MDRNLKPTRAELEKLHRAHSFVLASAAATNRASEALSISDVETAAFALGDLKTQVEAALDEVSDVLGARMRVANHVAREALSALERIVTSRDPGAAMDEAQIAAHTDALAVLNKAGRNE